MTDQENLLFLIHSQLLHVAYALVGFDSISRSHVNFFVDEQKEDLYHLSLSKLEVNFFEGSERRTLVK